MDSNQKVIFEMASQKKKYKKNQAVGKHIHSSISSWLFVFFFVILIPLLHFKSTIDPVHYPRFLAMAVGLFAMTGFFYFDKNLSLRDLLKNRFFRIYAAFILISVVAMVFAINPVESITDLLKWIMAGLLILYTTFIFSKDKSAIDLLIKAMIINAALAVIFGAYQFINFVIGSDDHNAMYAIKGLMAHKNQYAISLFLLLPFLAAAISRQTGSWKKAAFIVLILDLLMILLVQTRSVWMGLFVCVLFSSVLLLTIYRKHPVPLKFRKQLNRMIAGAALLMVIGIVLLMVVPRTSPIAGIKNRVASVFDTQQTSNSWRIEMWYATSDMVLDHLWIGVGGGNWILAIYPYYGKYLPSVFRQWSHPHNDFLGVASEKGIPALILYLLLFGYLFYRSLKTLNKIDSPSTWWMLFWMINGLAGFMVISFFSFPAERINQVIFISLIAAVIMHIGKSEKKQTTVYQSHPNNWIWVVPFLLTGFSIYFGIVSVRMEYYIAKAQKAKDQGQFEKLKRFADKGYHRLAPIEPRFSFPVITYKGMAAFYGRKDFPTALKYFREAERQHPTNISLINNIGSTYGQMAEFDSCQTYYQKSLNIFPHYNHALINLARAYYLQGNYPQAYRYLLSCDPQNKDEKLDLLRNQLEKLLD